jgi:hypothetical protein
MSKIRSVLGILSIVACAPERIVAKSSAPQVLTERNAISDSEYVAMCEHRPGARIRLYGCTPRGPSQPALIVIDGELLPIDTAGPGRAKRERVVAALDPNMIESVVVSNRGDSTAMAKYGDAARFGVITITMRPSLKEKSRQMQPTAR